MRVFVFILCILLHFASLCDAQEPGTVQYHFTGRVTTVAVNGMTDPGVIRVGDPVDGSFSYAIDQPGTLISASLMQYSFAAMSAKINGYRFDSAPAPDYRIMTIYDTNVTDQIHLQAAPVGWPSSFPLRTPEQRSMVVALYDDIGQSLSSLAVPTNLSLSQFPLVHVGSIRAEFVGGVSGNEIANTVYFVEFALDSLQQSGNSTIIRMPPYDFFVGCNNISEVAGFGSSSSTAVSSDPIAGRISLNVQAAGLVANTYGRGGVGITHIPSTNGMITIRSTIRISGNDFVSATSLRIARIGIKGGVASVESNTFLTAAPPVDAITRSRFRAAIVTPISGGDGINPFFASEQHNYSPPETFVVEHRTYGSAGQQLRICTGVDAKAVTTSFPATWASGKALYVAEVLKIEIIQ